MIINLIKSHYSNTSSQSRPTSKSTDQSVFAWVRWSNLTIKHWVWAALATLFQALLGWTRQRSTVLHPPLSVSDPRLVVQHPYLFHLPGRTEANPAAEGPEYLQVAQGRCSEQETRAAWAMRRLKNHFKYGDQHWQPTTSSKLAIQRRGCTPNTIQQ